MTGVLPNWLERLLGVEATDAGEGTVWSLENSWSWPAWVTLVFLGVAAAFILWAYFHEAGGAGRATRLLLAALRFSLAGLVLLMIAEWSLSLKRTGLPYVVLMVDDSESMARIDSYEDKAVRAAAAELLEAAELSPATRFNLAKALLLRDDAALLTNIQERYKLRVYFVSEEARVQSGSQAQLVEDLKAAEPRGASSRLGSGVRAALNDLRGAPPAAIVVLTDGITTEGETLSDVALFARRKSVPLFTVGIGDERPVRDIRLDDMLVDEVVFVDDVVNFEATVTSIGYEGRQVELSLRDKQQAKALAKVTVTLEPNEEQQKVIIPYRPTAIGDFEYVLELGTLPQEARLENNRLEQRVKVREANIRVLLVQSYPNYEYRYLRQMLRRDRTIELYTLLQEADVQYAELPKTPPRAPGVVGPGGSLRVFPVRRDELFEYDVIVFGDVDPSYLSAGALSNIADFVTEKGGGVIFVCGQHYTPLAYRDTPLASLFPLELGSVALPGDEPLVEGFVAQPTKLGLASPPLQIGDSSADSLEKWKGLPELYWLLEAPNLRPAARVLAEHPTRTAADGSPLPVIAMQYVGAGKVVTHLTDETWRWRFRIGDVLFARYWVQTIRYLSPKLGSGVARLTSDRKTYSRGDSVRLRVRFLNEQLAPPQDDGVTVMIERPGAQNQQVTLVRSSASRGVFEGAIASPPEGVYHAWIAQPTLQGETSIDFVVEAPPGENERTPLDGDELRRAAGADPRGKFYTLATAGALLDDLPQRRQVPIDSLPSIALWNKWPVLAVFLVLLVTEWILRKRKGML